MTYKTIYTQVEVDVDLSEFDTQELVEELESRADMLGEDLSDHEGNKNLINTIFHKRRNGVDYQTELDKLIYKTIGRIV